MERRNVMVLSAVFFLTAAIFVASGSPVFAQAPCIAQASYPVVSTPQYNYNFAVTVPVSTSCSYTVGPLFAVGDAYDTTVSTDLGTVSTGLSLVGGGSYSGQLVFSLPTSTLGHTVQFSVSIYNNYNGQSGPPLATTSQSITIGSTINQSYCQPGYSNIGGTCYPSPSQSYPYTNCPPGYANVGGTCYPPSYYSNCYNGYYGGNGCYPGYYSNNYYSSNYYGNSNNGNYYNGNGNNWNHPNWNNGNNNWNHGNGNWNNGNGNWNHGNGNNNWTPGNGNNNWNHGNGNGNWNNGNGNGHHHHHG